VTAALTINIIREQARLALAEDLGEGDITGSLISESAVATATVICREAAVICGCEWFNQVFDLLDPSIHIDWHVEDSYRVEPGKMLCSLTGPARALLTGERTALNFLQTLSGTATRAAQYVAEVEGTGVAVLDTRKTLPGLRLAQKYAVKCGGGRNHRIGLFDGVLIKENHIAAAGSIANAVGWARQSASVGMPVEVEVENMQEIEEALAAKADILLLDNMSPALLREAVDLVKRRAQLEASGGITLGNIREIAETGVDFISVGEMTKNVAAIDLSMRFSSQPASELQ
jgi:nicotinate-nucleotide pyrophosphorylase (carboxylating)